MGKIIFALGLINFFHISYAQPVRSEFNVSAGLAFPVGKFGSNDINSDQSGIAKAGPMVELSYNYGLKKSYGIVVSLTGLINPLNHQSLERSFDQTPLSAGSFIVWSGSGAPPQPSGNPPIYPNWQFKKSSWKAGALLFGGYAEQAAGQSIFLFRGMVGAIVASSPRVDGSSVTDTAIAHITQSSETAAGLAYSVTASLKVKLRSRLYFIADADYLGTMKLTFSGVRETVTTAHGLPGAGNITSQSTLTGNLKQTINVLGVKLGLAITL
jgi:hypothetical protein